VTDSTFADDIATARAQVADPGYAERVYAALLGKVIGVYVGRPFEGWTHERITERFGWIDRYVAEDLDKRIVVTDDDIAGTITFLRAAIGRGYEVTSEDVADVWLDSLVEGRSVLWWGGMGNSTEHTAYLRLRAGYRPPFSGSAELNGRVVSEQIGAQIFIDGWGLIAPGAPRLAAELARRAAVVSHDGEAVYGAQVVAAMEAAAFTTSDINRIIDAGLDTVPADSLIATLVADLREWRRSEPDWRRARDLLDERYGYHRYGGGCHMIPNHGLIILALLYCDSDFDRAMMIVNTAGWDTDCNSGNVGCLLGLIAGLDGIDAGYDWRGPVADRIYVPTADSGGGITDVVIESRRIVEIARAATDATHEPVAAPRFDFEFPGSLQGFRLGGSGEVRNEPLPGTDGSDTRGLRVIADGRVELTTPTFTPLEAVSFTSYPLDAAPTAYSGQLVDLRYVFDAEEPGAATVTPLVRFYDGGDRVRTVFGETRPVHPGSGRLTWTIPQLDAQPICEIGVAVEGGDGYFVLDSLDWSGTPTVETVRPGGNGELWRRAWVNETDFQHPDTEEGIRLISNGPRRLAITGTTEWRDYTVEARLTPHAAEAVGLAARVQGLRRYYLVRLDSRGEAQLIRRRGETERVVSRMRLPWRPGAEYVVRIDAAGSVVTAWVDGERLGSFDDGIDGLASGGVAISCEGGRLGCSSVRVSELPTP
jgi:ADP-ribosylglycohydrolase